MFWFFGRKAGGVFAPQPGMEPAPTALVGEVLTAGPPAKSQECSVLLACLSPVLKSGFPLPPSLFFTSLDGCVYWRIKQKVCAFRAAHKRRRFDGSLGREDPLEEDMATPSSILAWRIPWTEGPGGLQTRGSPRVRHDRVTEQSSLHDSLSLGWRPVFQDHRGYCLNTQSARAQQTRTEYPALEL